MRDRRRTPSRPRPETLAIAARKSARPVSYASTCIGYSVEEELIMTRVFAQKLLKLLQLRNPTMADAYLDALEIDARATIDRAFEAMLLMLFRHNVLVEPVRKLLWLHDSQADQYAVTYPNDTYEIVGTDRLLQMAGIA